MNEAEEKQKKVDNYKEDLRKMMKEAPTKVENTHSYKFMIRFIDLSVMKLGSCKLACDIASVMKISISNEVGEDIALRDEIVQFYVNSLDDLYTTLTIKYGDEIAKMMLINKARDMHCVF